MTTFKIVKKSKHDFNKELDNISSKIKEESEKEINPSQTDSKIKMEIQPHDKVMFQGKKAEVLSTWPETNEIIILLDGMTVECSKSQVQLIDKIDTMDVPMKFKDGLPVEEKLYVRCGFKGNSPLNLVSEAYVNFKEYIRKKGKQKVRVVTESDFFDTPKEEVALLEFPASEDKTEGYVQGVIVGSEGEAERKCMIKAVDYAEAIADDTRIPVLYYTEDGYVDGSAPKSVLRTLSV